MLNVTGGLTAIIPVRAGSKRLRNKNILPFGESNLLIHKINQLKKVDAVNEIVVSSDSDEMLDMAKKEGVLVHKRELIYADEITKSFSEVIMNVVSHCGTREHVMWAPCVCPLCDENDFKNAIESYNKKVLETKCFDSIISSKYFKEYLWDEYKPINYSLGEGHVPSQQLPNFQTIVNGFYLASRENMLTWKYFFGLKPYRLEISQVHAIDIDTEFDYQCALVAWSLR
ncbi:acylneuraminate cytidylyltransferase family protein [Campylobacter coli]|nr:acylneuraminate cytidylyltransferase family protein [Campylobacter coli]